MTFDQALEIDLVQEQMKKVNTFVAEAMTHGVQRALFHQMNSQPSCDSPIEVVFKMWWEAVTRTEWFQPWGELALEPQHVVAVDGASYRLDFKVSSEVAFGKMLTDKYRVVFPNIGIELDGHDFHERTKKQVEHRNKRDRDLQRAGWKIFHFSGSELVRDPARCVTEVLQHSSNEMCRFYGSIGRILSMVE